VARLAGIPAEVIAHAKKILLRIENGEHSFARPEASAGSRRSAPLQLDLFRPAASEVIERLREVDIARMSPLEALNLLSRLQDLALREGGGTKTSG
jgi:DNA mismatch repair protein MutS